MKLYQIKMLKISIAAIFLLAGIQTAPAQIPLPGGDDDVDDAPTAPIDGLLGFGLITGVIYGIRKIRKRD